MARPHPKPKGGDGRFTCAECGTLAPPGARGWRAMLTVGDEDAEDVEEVAIYCPRCAGREFESHV